MTGFKSVEETGFFKNILKRFMPEPKVYCSECKHFHPLYQCWLPGQIETINIEDNPISRARIDTCEKRYTNALEKNEYNHCKDYSPKEN